MQVFYFLKGDKIVERSIASPAVCVLPGVPWGRPDMLFTAAYWLSQYWMREDGFPDRCHRLGRTFREEVAACILGGHGIPAEVGLAAFQRLRDRGLIGAKCPSASLLSESLREPLIVQGRQVIYRFWSKKAEHLSAALTALQENPVPMGSARTLRDYLTRLPGIGPKTASWIVRNWLGSCEVAILDIHIVRAGQLMGLYTAFDRIDQHYLRMESRFLDLAKAMNVPAADLDSLIWSEMRRTPRIVSRLLVTDTEVIARSSRLSKRARSLPA